MTHDKLSGAPWRKSSFSGNSGNCVEVAVTGSAIGVRDSKDRDGNVLSFTPGGWREFLAAVQDGQFGR